MILESSLGVGACSSSWRGPEGLRYQLQQFDTSRTPSWIEDAAQVRQRNLRCRIMPVKQEVICQPLGKMTMSGDIALSSHDIVTRVLGDEARAESEEHCLSRNRSHWS